MEKPVEYYMDLLLEVLREYEDEDDYKLMVKDVSGDPYHAERLKEEIEIAEMEAWLRHYTVDEYEKAREFIESNFTDIV